MKQIFENNKEEPLISIIVPIYNAEKYLDKCIDSIVNQTYKNLQIILVNDGSSDNSGKMCDEWEKKDKRIDVIHKKNAGVSAARNSGLDRAQGMYIGFIDSDDYIEENMYELLMKSIIENNSNISICNYNTIENGNVKEGIKNKPKKSFAAELVTPFGICGFGVNKLYDAELLKNIRFDEEVYIWEDTLFNFNIAKNHEIRYSYIDDRLYNYVQLESSAVHSVKPEKQVTILKVHNEIVNVLQNIDKNLANERKAQFILTVANFAYKYKENVEQYKIDQYLEIAKEYVKKGFLKEKVSIIIKIKIVFAIYLPQLYNILKNS